MKKEFIENILLSFCGVFGVVFGVLFLSFALNKNLLKLYIAGFLIIIIGTISIAYIFSKNES